MVRVGDSTGCHKVNNIRRMPREQWRDQELVKSLIGMPWDPTPNTERPQALGDIPVGVALDPVVPEEELPPHLRIRAAETVPRHVKIRREVELRRYGYSEQCLGFDAAKSSAQPRNHTATCRQRIEEAIAKDNKELLRGS